jgi:uncharacterized protein (DUF2237 family)
MLPWVAKGSACAAETDRLQARGKSGTILQHRPEKVARRTPAARNRRLADGAIPFRRDWQQRPHRPCAWPASPPKDQLHSRGVKSMSDEQRNVFGEAIEVCSLNPTTGFYRTGCCETGPEDVGVHTVCVEVTAEFLAFSKARGNDLSTPRPEFGFPGLTPGNRWCLCAARWQEALDAGAAPRVVLAATHEATLEIVRLADLKRHALDLA